MENCGIGACVSDQAACASAIVNMVVSTLSSIADIVLLIVTFGSSSATTSNKQQLTNSIKKIGQQGLKASVKGAVKVLKGRFQKDIIKKALEKVKDHIKDSAFGALKANFITAYCTAVYETVINKANPETTFNLDTVAGSLDVLNLKGTIEGCSNTSDGGLKCAKNVLNGISTFDPTGLLGVTTAFMHPECDVPTPIVSKQNDSPDELQILALGECEKKCEEIINHCINHPQNKGFEKECRTNFAACKTKCNVEVCSESCQYKEQLCIGESLFDKNFCANQKKLCYDANCKNMSKCASDCDYRVNYCEITYPNKKETCNWEIKPHCFIECNKNNSIGTDNKKFYYEYFQPCVDHVQQCKSSPTNRGQEKLCENIFPVCNAEHTIYMCKESCQKKEQECLSSSSSDSSLSGNSFSQWRLDTNLYCSKMKSICFDKHCNKFSSCVSNCDTQANECENNNRNNHAAKEKCQLESKFNCYRNCNNK